MIRFVDPATKDIFDRLSHSSISRHEHELSAKTLHEHDVATTTPPYGEVESPSALLQPGIESPSQKISVGVFDRRWFGLAVHSCVVGVISAGLPLTVFPFLTNNLNMEGTQTLSARTMLALPWMLKPFINILLNSLPLFGGYLKRPYVLLGWAICAAALITIHHYDQPAPFFIERAKDFVGTPLSKMDAAQLKLINFNAPSYGAMYVMYMTIATIGYVIADVAADALLKDLQRQHFYVAKGGNEILVETMTQLRFQAMLATFLYMGVSMSGWDYGGDFDFTLEYVDNMLIFGLLSLLPILFGWWTVTEHKHERYSFQKSFGDIWELLNNRAVNFVLLCRFLGGIFAGVSATGVNPIAFYWAHVQPLNDNVVSFVSTAVVLGFLSYADRKGWNINYRLVLLAATCILLFMDCGATMFTIWNIVRSQWFWIGMPVMEAIPSCLDYVIFNVILSEITEPGMEDAMGSIVTAIAFLSGAFGLTLTKYIDAQFDITNQDIMLDTTRVRWHATVTFAIAYLCQVLSLGWLLVLPRHANEAREWKKHSGTSTRNAVGLLALLLAALVYSITIHVLSVNESTSCLRLAGGRGCGADDDTHI